LCVRKRHTLVLLNNNDARIKNKGGTLVERGGESV